MKYTVALLWTFSLMSTCLSQSSEEEQKRIEITSQIAKQFESGDYELIRGQFDANMKAALSADQLKEVWEQLLSQLGEYEERGVVTTSKIQQYEVVYMELKFRLAPFKLKVVFNEAEEVAGLFLIPVTAE